MTVRASRLADHGRAQHVGVHERERVHQGPVDVRLRGEVDDRVDLTGKPVHQLPVTDVAMKEAIAGLALELREVGGIAGVGQLVEGPELGVGALAPEQADEIAADESGGSGHEQPGEPATHVISGNAVQS